VSVSVADGRPQRSRQLYGRRISRPLGDQLADLVETRLPGLRLDLDAEPPTPLSRLFGPETADVWLEIGFGGGEHLVWQAEAHPDIGFIGCEPFLNGVGKFLRGADEAGLANVRLHDDDARHVLDWLPDASIGRAFVLFPDPWPKKRHRKRRFLSEAGLARLARVMRQGATLRFATDIADYAEMVEIAVRVEGSFAPNPGVLAGRPADWPLTRYAQKAVAAGRDCRYFVYRRR
jgi:tRNA (guanine-N7-)-methyltransferase